MNVLVVAAHPDDEVLGCGGAMARWSQEGCDVSIAILGEGITSRYSKPDEADASQMDLLRSNSRAAGRMLGAKDVFFQQLPDNRFDTVALLDVVKIVEDLIERVQPEIIF
ncbi:MAG: PIG-L family deacetylase, partial [Candidatus Omnitrophica bacterium]|nr:PIG-L family deacetylase [Candidatus Omnitrophota bacterium]